MKLTKRLLATVMALALLLGVVPFAAMAGEATVLTLNTPVEVMGTYEEPAILTFTPEQTGVYVLSSESDDGDPQARLYCDEVELAHSDDSDTLQFALLYMLHAGVEYEYRVDNRDYEIPVRVTLVCNRLVVPIALGETKEVVATDDDPAFFSFTPPETGTYVLYSEDGSDPQAKLYQDDQELAYSDDSDDTYQFRLAYDLIAGTEYFYKVDNRSSEDPFCVTLIRGIPAESVTINGVENDTVTIPVSNANHYFDVTVYPENADVMLSWTSGDENIFTVCDGELTFNTIGTTTLTVTAGEASHTITVTVVEPSEALIDGENTVSFAAEEHYRVLTYTPSTTGRHHFYWEGALGWYNYMMVSELVEDGWMSYINNSFDSKGYPCSMGAYLEEGHTYIVTLKYDYGYEHGDVDTKLTVGVEVEPNELYFKEGSSVNVVYNEEGTYFEVTPIYRPVLSMLQSIEMESSDPTVAEVSYYDGYSCQVEAHKTGTTTITATLSNGITAELELNVVGKPNLELDKEYTYAAHSVTDGFLYGEEMRYTFTPEWDGRYVMEYDTHEGVIAYFYAPNDDEGYYVSIYNGLNYLNLQKDKSYEFVLRTDWEKVVTADFVLKALLPPTSVTCEEDAITMDLFDWRDIPYTVEPTNSDVSHITFTSSDESIVYVDSNGSMRAEGIGTATVTVQIPNGMQDTLTVTVNRPASWVGEKTENMIITPYSDEKVYELVVDTDGWYEIYSEGNFDPYADLYEWSEKDGMQCMASAEDEVGENFRMVVYLEKGVYYYLDVFCDEYLAEFPVTVRACDEEDNEDDEDYEDIDSGVKFLKDSLSVSAGDLFVPEYIIGESEWIEEASYSTPGVLTDFAFGGWKHLALAAGKVTMTYTTNLGNTDTIDITVNGDMGTVIEDQAVTVTLNETTVGRFYRFVPATSGDYVFYSKSEDGDPYVYLFDESFEEIDHDDDRDDIAMLDFYLEERLTAGDVYYVLFTSYSAEDFSYEAGVALSAAASDYIVDLDKEDLLFEENGVYYVMQGEYTYIDILPVPYEGKIGNVEYDLEGEAWMYDYEIEFTECGDVTVTVMVKGLKDTVLNFRVVDVAAGDLNFDGKLDETDVQMLYDHLNGTKDLGLRALLANMDDNGVIDADDLALLCEEAGVENPGKIGDVNGDNKVDSTDARLTLQFAVGKIGKDQLTVALADVNGDNKVDSTDARLILQFAVGKIQAFPSKK